MAEFWAVRKGNSLVPDNADSAAILGKLPFGKPIKVTTARPRNLAFHRLYWTLCDRIAAAVGSEPENVSDMLKIASGHCTIVQSKSYGVLRLPKSISFAAMDATEFKGFFDRCVNVVQTEWGIAREDILETVKDLLHPEEIGT